MMRTLTLPDSLPVVGGDSLYEHLAAGRAAGSSCSRRDDRDTNEAGEVGFWFYLNFTGELVDWVDL